MLVDYVSAPQRVLGGFCSWDHSHISSFKCMSVNFLYSSVLLIEISLNLKFPESLIL